MDAIFQFLRRRAVGKVLELSPKTSPKHTFEGHQEDVWSFVFLQDNAHIVSGSEDGTMRKWDCETGQLVGEPWKGKGKIYALALSPDGKTIACGRENGRVEQWDTDGQMKEGIWTGHSDWVRSLSWSPSGDHLASGSGDGTILVRRVESGAVEVGPIKTDQGWVWSVAYSPLGDRIASGGDNWTICIWDSHTGELLVGPINDLAWSVYSIVWSSDSSKLYSASDLLARVFDSTSGTLLHLFQHDDFLRSVALSPTHNLLACVGWRGTAQLWDTVSHQPFPIDSKASNIIRHVSFSPDGRYLAYGGDDKKITLWTVGDIVEPLVATASTSVQDGMQQQILPKSQSSSSLNAGDANLLEQSAANDAEGHKNPYRKFFTPSHQSPPSPSRRSPLERASSALFKWSPRQDNHDIKLQHRLPPVVDVPFTKRKKMYCSRQEVDAEKKKASEAKKARNAKNEKKNRNALARSSHPQSNVTQQPVGSSQVQSSSGPQVAVATLSITPVDRDVNPPDATVAVAHLPDVTTHTGCLTRFLLFICCLSAQRTSDSRQ